MTETVSPTIRRITIIAVAGVAAVAAAVNFLHVQILTQSVGEDWRSWLEPIPVDGLIVAASMTMLIRRRAGRRAGALVWISLVVGILVSLAANVAAASPSLIGRIVAAWPPLALLLSFEMLMIQVRERAAEVVDYIEAAAEVERIEPEPAPLVEPVTALSVDLVAAAIEFYRSEEAAGRVLKGRELGAHFDRSTTWGCNVIRQAREQSGEKPTFVALASV